jgi:hypothetical protein
VLFGLTWTIRNLPDAATFEAPVVTMPISLPAGQGAPLRSHLSVELDKIRLSDLRRVWDELGGDPVLIAEYRVKGRSTSVETRLTLPRTYIVAAIAPWRKMVGLPPEA